MSRSLMYNEKNGDKLTLSNSIITFKEFSCHTIHFYHRFGFHVHIFNIIKTYTLNTIGY